MQGHAALMGDAEGVENGAQLGRVADVENPLAAGLHGELVEFQAEGPLEQAGQPGAEFRIFRDDAQLVRPEGVAVEHHAVGLRQSAAAPADGGAAQLGLCIG